jgi:hypothetical protein
VTQTHDRIPDTRIASSYPGVDRPGTGRTAWPEATEAVPRCRLIVRRRLLPDQDEETPDMGEQRHAPDSV